MGRTRLLVVSGDNRRSSTAADCSPTPRVGGADRGGDLFGAYEHRRSSKRDRAIVCAAEGYRTVLQLSASVETDRAISLFARIGHAADVAYRLGGPQSHITRAFTPSRSAPTASRRLASTGASKAATERHGGHAVELLNGLGPFGYVPLASRSSHVGLYASITDEQCARTGCNCDLAPDETRRVSSGTAPKRRTAS
jgi:hypothetical protein